MQDNNSFTSEELELSAEMISHMLRMTTMEVSFLQRAVYSLKPEPTDETTSICADYKYLYYNPKWVISAYSQKKNKLMNSIIHTVLHSLYLHPSGRAEKDELFDTVADFAVFCMMNSGEMINASSSLSSDIFAFAEKYGKTSTADLLDLAKKDTMALKKMTAIVSRLKDDDHSMWYLSREKKQQDNGTGASGNRIPSEDEKSWARLLENVKAGAHGIGSRHGNMFVEIHRPDRFSRFSYLEYIRRFAVQEILLEDPETFDMIMYTWGMDNLDNTPILEFNETRERCSVTDIVIAIDMSGSCGGNIAVNFLRQIYTLFEQMNIRSSVNIHVVTFDTVIINQKIIRSRKDADALIKNYEGSGWGGTDFQCVFDYANNFPKQNHGKKLKGLFFFSDAMGIFPCEKPSYRTTFFVPEESCDTFCSSYVPSVPDWVELVRYKDKL